MNHKCIKAVYLLTLILFSCNFSKVETKNHTTIVCGKVTNQNKETSKIITVLACEPLNKKDKYAVRLDSMGNFRAEFEMLWSHSFTLNYDKKFINAYAELGDSIYVEIDAQKFRNQNSSAIQFGGKNSKRNKEFNQTLTALLPAVGYNSFKDFTLPLNEFMIEFEKEVKKINDTVSSYCEKNNMSNWTQNIARDMLLYVLSNYAIDYKGKSEKDRLDFFTQPIFDIYNEEKFSNMMFPYHLDAYFYHLIQQDTLIANVYNAKNFSQTEKYALKKILKMPKCLSRDYMLVRLYSAIEGDENSIDENIFHSKDVYSKVLELKEPVQPSDLPKIESGKGAFYMTKEGKIENIADFNFEKLIKERYKGKVVYLDVWAAWCGPCRAEMSLAKELHKLFVGKDVAFLSICMSSKQEEWIKVVTDNKVEGDHYYFDNDLSAEASANMLSGGYPTYILIDKNGKIRNGQAPRPSALADAGEAIEKLLHEK